MDSSANESALPLLTAVVVTAAILVGSGLAFGSPPSQPPFPYESFTAHLGQVPMGDCGKKGHQLGMYAPQAPDLLPTAFIAYGGLKQITFSRTRLFLARSRPKTARWLWELSPQESENLAAVDYRRCSVLVVVVSGNVDAGWIGFRLNNRRTLTVGLYSSPHSTGFFCDSAGGTTGTVTGPTSPDCYDHLPVSGIYLVEAVPAQAVANVQYLYGITQEPPPPPPLGSTTG